MVWVYPDELFQTISRADRVATMQQLSHGEWRVVLTVAGEPHMEEVEGLTIVSLPRPKLFLLGNAVFHLAFLLWLAANHGSTHIVLCHPESLPFLLPIVLLRRLFGSAKPRIVVDTRTLPMSIVSWRGRLRARYSRLCRWLANHLADGQTAITPAMAEALGIPARQLLGTWPSCVDPEPFVKAASGRAWPKREDPLRLIYTGTLDEGRGLPALAKAARMVHGEGHLLTLTVVGCSSEGPDTPELRELRRCAEQEDDGVITILPPVPHSEMPRLLAGAHVGVLPFPDELKFRVSSPIKLFEYMASGLAILATRIACHTDVLGEGEERALWAGTGSVEELAAAIRGACVRKADLPEMGRRAGVAAYAWTDEAAAEKLSVALHRALRRVAAQKKRSPQAVCR